MQSFIKFKIYKIQTNQTQTRTDILDNIYWSKLGAKYLEDH